MISNRFQIPTRDAIIIRKMTTRLEYLPVGYYVLAESRNPEGYATSEPILITIEDIGHLERIQYAQMGSDEP